MVNYPIMLIAINQSSHTGLLGILNITSELLHFLVTKVTVPSIHMAPYLTSFRSLITCHLGEAFTDCPM